ncbi:MAG: monovalent cation/H+ antiporter subunit D family protein, partial [Rubripirellula sp.]
MIEAHLPVLLIVLPMMAAPLCVLAGNRKAAYAIALLTTLATLAIGIRLMSTVLSTGAIHYEIGGWKPPYGIEYVVDSFNAFVILIVSAMAAITMVYAPPSLDKEILPSKHYLFYATFLLCMTGLLGMCVTGDLFNVFVFLEISSLSS